MEADRGPRAAVEMFESPRNMANVSGEDIELLFVYKFLALKLNR